MHAFIRKWLADKVSQEVSAATRIIYGKNMQTRDISTWDSPVRQGPVINAVACTFVTQIKLPQGNVALAWSFSMNACTSVFTG